MERQVLTAAFVELSPDTLYGILRLRSEVFVVEQACVFLDLDDRDREPGARHYVTADAGEVVCYLRVLPETGPVPTSIGRVVTARSHRSRGLARELLAIALADVPGPVSINAQSQLVPWYASLGFSANGEEFEEDGILHTPMVRT